PGSLEEAGEVLLDDPGADLAAGGDGEADGAIVRLDLDHEGPQHVQPEGLPGLRVLGIDGHGGRDVIVDPVVRTLVVVVGAAAGDGVGAHMRDGAVRGAHARASSVSAGTVVDVSAVAGSVSSWSKRTRILPAGPRPAARAVKASCASSAPMMRLTIAAACSSCSRIQAVASATSWAV